MCYNTEIVMIYKNDNELKCALRTKSLNQQRALSNQREFIKKRDEYKEYLDLANTYISFECNRRDLNFDRREVAVNDDIYWWLLVVYIYENKETRYLKNRDEIYEASENMHPEQANYYIRTHIEHREYYIYFKCKIYKELFLSKLNKEEYEKIVLQKIKDGCTPEYLDCNYPENTYILNSNVKCNDFKLDLNVSKHQTIYNPHGYNANTNLFSIHKKNYIAVYNDMFTDTGKSQEHSEPKHKIDTRSLWQQIKDYFK